MRRLRRMSFIVAASIAIELGISAALADPAADPGTSDFSGAMSLRGTNSPIVICIWNISSIWDVGSNASDTTSRPT